MYILRYHFGYDICGLTNPSDESVGILKITLNCHGLPRERKRSSSSDIAE